MSVNSNNSLNVVSAFDHYYHPERAGQEAEFAKEVAALDKQFPACFRDPNTSRYIPSCAREYGQALQQLEARFSFTPARETTTRFCELGLNGIQNQKGDEVAARLQARAREYIPFRPGAENRENARQLIDALEVVSSFVIENHVAKSGEAGQEQLEHTIHNLESLRQNLLDDDQENVEYFRDRVIEDLTRLPVDSLNFRDQQPYARMLKLARERLPDWLQPEVRQDVPAVAVPPVAIQPAQPQPQPQLQAQPQLTQVQPTPVPPPAPTVQELVARTMQISVANDTNDELTYPGTENDDLTAFPVAVPQGRAPVNAQRGVDQSVVPDAIRNRQGQDQGVLTSYQSEASQVQQQRNVGQRNLITYFPEASQANSEKLRTLLRVRDVASLSLDQTHNVLKIRSIDGLRDIKRPSMLHLTSRKELRAAIDALELFCLYATHSDKALASNDPGKNDQLIRDAMESLETLRNAALRDRSVARPVVSTVIQQINQICTRCLDEEERDEFDRLITKSEQVLGHFISRT